jgi:phage terminase large subunit
MEIEIDYEPRKWAESLHPTYKRWIALVLHRRIGKTTAIMNHLQHAATDDDWERERLRYLAPELTVSEIEELVHPPGGRFYGHILPTYKQAKLTVWERLKYYARPIPGVKFNESELSVVYPTGNWYGLFGADNPDSLRGIGPSGVAFDEYSQQPGNIFSEVLSKALADHLGFAIFSGTVKGKNQLFRTFEAFKNDPKAFAVWQDIDKSLETERGATVTVLKRALEDDLGLVAQGLMTQEEVEQEWYLSTDAAIKGAYYAAQIAAARKQGRIKSVPYDPALSVHVVWDLGVGQNLAAGFYQRIGSETHKIDFWEGSNKDGMPQAVKALQNKPYTYGKMFVPHDAEGTESGTGKTRLATAKELWPNVEWVVVPKVAVDDGIARAKLMFARLWVDETNCQLWLDYIAQYRQEWDDSKGMFKENPLHDFTSHAADEFRYAAVIEDQMTNEIPSYNPYHYMAKKEKPKNQAR